jgi:hypothetical protein
VGLEHFELWANSVLPPGRRIYEGAGLKLIDAAQRHSLGQDVVGLTWMLTLLRRLSTLNRTLFLPRG